jgi:hypothetical protein
MCRTDIGDLRVGVAEVKEDEVSRQIRDSRQPLAAGSSMEVVQVKSGVDRPLNVQGIGTWWTDEVQIEVE